MAWLPITSLGMVFVVSNSRRLVLPHSFSLPPQAAGAVAPKKTFLRDAKSINYYSTLLAVEGAPKSCPKFRSAGEGNRTLVSSLEGYSFTIKLHPR